MWACCSWHHHRCCLSSPQGIVSGALISLKEDAELRIDTTWRQELLVALAVGTAGVAVAFTAPIARRLGPRTVIALSALCFTAGSLCMALTSSYGMLLVGRATVGIAIGCSSSVVPGYLAELSPPAARGRIGALNVVMITGGQGLAGVVAGLLFSVPQAWRWMLGLGAVPAILQLGCLGALPRSPAWLQRMGREAEAEAIRANMVRGSVRAGYLNLTPQPSASEGSASDDSDSTRGGQSLSTHQEPTLHPLVLKPGPCSTLRGICSHKLHRRALVVGSVLQLLQQVAGINTVMYYSGQLMNAAGFNAHTSTWLTAAVGALNCAGTVLGALLVDRVGRRRLLFSTGTLVVLALVGMGAVLQHHGSLQPKLDHSLACAGLPAGQTWQPAPANSSCLAAPSCADCLQSLNLAGSCTFWYNDATNVGMCAPVSAAPTCALPSAVHTQAGACGSPQYNAWGWTVLACVGVYLVVFAPGIGQLPWTINGELHPHAGRDTALSFTTGWNWASNFVVSLTFLSFLKLGAALAFSFYALCSALMLVYLAARLPETKGVPLSQTPGLFRRQRCCRSGGRPSSLGLRY